MPSFLWSTPEQLNLPQFNFLILRKIVLTQNLSWCLEKPFKSWSINEKFQYVCPYSTHKINLKLRSTEQRSLLLRHHVNDIKSFQEIYNERFACFHLEQHLCHCYLTIEKYKDAQNIREWVLKCCNSKRFRITKYAAQLTAVEKMFIVTTKR